MEPALKRTIADMLAVRRMNEVCDEVGDNGGDDMVEGRMCVGGKRGGGGSEGGREDGWCLEEGGRWKIVGGCSRRGDRGGWVALALNV